MTREEKIARARELRAAGWTLAAIGAELGAAPSTVIRWTDPEKAERSRETSRRWKQENRGRCRAYDAEYDRHHRGRCRRCGGPSRRQGQGSVCRSCIAASVHERRVVLEQLWAAGWSLREIADYFGWTIGHVSSEFVRARRAGYDLPCR